MHEIKKTEASEDMKANAEIDIQTITDKFIDDVDQHYKIKEEERLKV